MVNITRLMVEEALVPDYSSRIRRKLEYVEETVDLVTSLSANDLERYVSIGRDLELVEGAENYNYFNLRLELMEERMRVLEDEL